MDEELVFVFDIPNTKRDPLLVACDIIGETDYIDSLISSHTLGNVAISFSVLDDSAPDPENLANKLLELLPEGTVLRGIAAPNITLLKLAWP